MSQVRASSSTRVSYDATTSRVTYDIVASGQRWFLAAANAKLCGNYCVPTPAVPISAEARKRAKAMADFLWGTERPRVNCC